MLRAVIITPPGAGHLWIPQCQAFADQHGWHVEALVADWDGWLGLACHDLADIGIVPRWDMLPPGRTPRVVAVEGQPPCETGRPTVSWAPSPAAPPPRRPSGR